MGNSQNEEETDPLMEALIPKTRDAIIQKLETTLGPDRIFHYKENESEENESASTLTQKRKNFANAIVKKFKDEDDYTKIDKPMYFSYIKLAEYVGEDEDKKGEIYGIVGCKSQINPKSKRPTDLLFYDLNKEIVKKKGYKKTAIAAAAEYMTKMKYDWYTTEVIVLKNKNDEDEKEALINESMLQNLFNLFD